MKRRLLGYTRDGLPVYSPTEKELAKMDDHLPHWEVIATYDVKPEAIARHRLEYNRAYIMKYHVEDGMRKHLGITDDTLDSFTASWYLTRVTASATA